MKTREEIKDEVIAAIREHLGTQGDISEDDTFVEKLGADSLDQVELVMMFEEKFSIDIPDDQAEAIKTVKDAIDLVDSHVNPKETL